MLHIHIYISFTKIMYVCALYEFFANTPLLDICCENAKILLQFYISIYIYTYICISDRYPSSQCNFQNDISKNKYLIVHTYTYFCVYIIYIYIFSLIYLFIDNDSLKYEISMISDFFFFFSAKRLLLFYMSYIYKKSFRF